MSLLRPGKLRSLTLFGMTEARRLRFLASGPLSALLSNLRPSVESSPFDMEQPCYKCGQAVEEGVPFCPHCSAPQIRVVVAEPPPSAAIAATGIAPASNGSAVLPMAQVSPGLPLRGAHVLRPCALAAIVACVLVLLGLNPFVAMVGVGFLAVVFYRQRLPGAPSNAIAGAGIGALGGLMFFAFIAAFMGLASAFPDFRTKFREQLIENAQKWAASRPAEPQIQAALDQLKTPEGFLMSMILAGFIFLIICPLIASIGGALAGAVFGRRSKL